MRTQKRFKPGLRVLTPSFHSKALLQSVQNVLGLSTWTKDSNIGGLVASEQVGVLPTASRKNMLPCS